HAGCSPVLVMVGVILAITLTCVFLACRAAVHPVAQPLAGCSSQMRLLPAEREGYFWQEHRHWLVGLTPFNDSRYIIVNMRTSGAYDWAFIHNNEQGRSVFGVPTRWTWFHPDWKDDPWLLMY